MSISCVLMTNNKLGMKEMKVEQAVQGQHEAKTEAMVMEKQVGKVVAKTGRWR